MAGLVSNNPFRPTGNGLGVASPRAQQQMRLVDEQVAIGEIQALRLDIDLTTGVDAASFVEPLRQSFRGSTAGDHLRLPQLTSLTGHEIRASVDRIVAIDTSAGAATEEAAVKEERMRRVLAALQRAGDHIDRQVCKPA